MMNYVELIVATLSGMPEREREQVLASVAKKFGYVIFGEAKTEVRPNAKPAPANGPTDKDIEFLKMAMRSLEEAFNATPTAKPQKPEDLLRGRK